MNGAPRDAELRNVIWDLVSSQVTYEMERVFILDPRGAIREVLYPSEGSSALRTRRAELLSRRQLGAIVHISIARTGVHGVGMVSMVEVFEQVGSEKYSIVSHPDWNRWTDTEPAAQKRWQELWGKEEPGTK